MAGQAAALSCRQPDAAETFKRLAASEDRYSVLLGTFDFTAPPQQSVSNDAQPQRVVAEFSGQGLAANGFGPIAPTSVTLQTSCAGPWCGGFPRSGSQFLVFVAVTDAGYVATLGPCGGTVFDATFAPIVEACMRGETCEGAAR